MNASTYSDIHYDFAIAAQPDKFTCGAASLHAMYAYLGDAIQCEQVVGEINHLPDGGTFASALGAHALARGYRVWLYTWNIQYFDPSWFDGSSAELVHKLEIQRERKSTPVFDFASRSYQQFLDLGGQIRTGELSASLLYSLLQEHGPLLLGLCATWLHRCPRERPDDMAMDSVAGVPTGHFIILHGMRGLTEALVSDPEQHRTFPFKHQYSVSMDRLLTAIALGGLTGDAEVLIINPRNHHGTSQRS